MGARPLGADAPSVMRRFLPGLIALAACEVVIGLERLPPLESTPDGATDAVADGPDDAAAGFCATSTGAYFCDDFDDANEAFGARWRGAPGFQSSPIKRGSANGTRVEATNARSKPYAFEAVAERTEPREGPTFVLFHLLERGAVDAPAIELRADVRVLKMAAGASPADAGDAGDAGRAEPRVVVLAAVAQIGFKLDGAQIMLSPDSASLVAGTIIGDPGVLGDASVQSVREGTTIAPVDVLGVSEITWLQLRLAMGAREAVVRRVKEATSVGEPSCPPSPAVAAAWLVIPPGRYACISVSDDLATLSKSAVAPLTGVFVADLGSVQLQIDDVRLDPIR